MQLSSNSHSSSHHGSHNTEARTQVEIVSYTLKRIVIQCSHNLRHLAPAGLVALGEGGGGAPALDGRPTDLILDEPHRHPEVGLRGKSPLSLQLQQGLAIGIAAVRRPRAWWWSSVDVAAS